MPAPPFPVLYEDNHLLVVSKPVMLPTMGVAADKPSLLTLAKDYLKHKYDKPGNVYLGIVSRLDAPVSGIVLLARTSKAAARLTEQFRSRSVEKVYWAIVPGPLEPAAGTLVDHLGKDDRHRRVHICQADAPGAQEARLDYRTLRKLPRGWLIEVELQTGRKHQIRVQLSHRRRPIVGDRKYGSRDAFPAGLALHSRRLVFSHPTTGQRIELEAPVPEAWRKFGVEN